MQLKLKDEAKAAIFGLPPTDIDSDVILQHYEARGWNTADIMRHIQAAIDAGAYEKQETRKEGSGGNESPDS